MATNKDILERLNCIEQNVSAGQLDEISQTVKEIKEILLDPEDGLIVRVNKNTYWRRELDVDEFKALVRWKQAMTHAMWVLYTIVAGVVAKIVFWK